MKRLGILGGGQLARMLALAAYPLGIETLCLDPNPEACAGQVTKIIQGNLNDKSVLTQFLEQVDLITYETENIPLAAAQWVAQTRPLLPCAKILEIAQDRLKEKSFFQALQIPTARFAAVSSEEDLKKAIADIGLPTVLKTRRLGYDGKGQYIIESESDISKAWSQLQNQELILEQFIHFDFEVSLIGVRSQQGEIRYYPLIKNHHRQGILQSSQAPFNHPDLEKQAQYYMEQILLELSYVGVLTVEFFYHNKQLIANEMAPRVHNSGHWTIEGAQTSQFANHLRAIYGWSLGCTEAVGNCFMLNCIGNMPPPEVYLQIPEAHYHTYGKAPRPGRKLGHVTLIEKKFI